MSTSKKILLAIPAIPILLLLLLALIWDPNWFKSSVTPHIEDLENHSIAFETIEHSLFSPGKITIRDILIRGPVAAGKINSLVVSVDVMKAIDKDILVNEVTLHQPNLEVDMQALNALLAEPSDATEETSTEKNQPLPVKSVFIRKVAIKEANIKDTSAMQQFSVEGLNLNLSEVNIAQNSKLILLEENAPVNASLNIHKLAVQSIHLGTFDSQVIATRDSVSIEQLSLDTGKSSVDLTASVNDLADNADIRLAINAANLQLEEFHPLFKDSPVIPSGITELTGSLTTTGQLTDANTLLQALNGNIAIGLRQGKLQGIDVNEMVTAFKDSKETDLKDIGSFVLTGPVGILAANMLDLGGGADAMEGETLIPHLSLNSAIINGSISLDNSAVSTDAYRLAFKGTINPLISTFEDFTFAVLNEQGCAELTQTLDGDMAQPTSAVAQSLLDSAIAPITGLLKTVQDTVSDCEPFYEGEVTHPVKSE